MVGPWVPLDKSRPLPKQTRKIDSRNCKCGHLNLDHRHFIDPVNGFVSDCLIEGCKCVLFMEKKAAGK